MFSQKNKQGLKVIRKTVEAHLIQLVKVHSPYLKSTVPVNQIFSEVNRCLLAHTQ